MSVLEKTNKSFGPFLLEEVVKDEDEIETCCLLCEDKFNLSLALPIFLCHLFEVHHVVIEDVQFIDNLEGYIKYWRERFKNVEMCSIVPSVPIQTTEKYYLISTLMKEDKELRHKLRLEKMLKVQEFERTDTNFRQTCLICRFEFEGLRRDYIGHLMSQHNFHLGNPQNLVYIDELIDRLQEKINSLQCIYCEGTFPDRNTLKEHMRKRQHKTINPLNKSYDKYYSVNYLEPDGAWDQHKKKHNDPPIALEASLNSDEEYEDWKEGKEDFIICLFCKHKETSKVLICNHMSQAHNFNFDCLVQELDFYLKVKLVNYIRKRMHELQCIYCETIFENDQLLQEHLATEEHFKMPDIKNFDQPEFFFPTYENDTLLYFLEDVDD
ncbi:zinc finger protein 277 [Agrilus planipennis]|uniref:Zinc finger protein 277 n=1 Tax=Agrilus planipennis TaxID=224129 RepID=A0A1W4WXT4_AGRPL|nr:zinc finger protein 277 [Agrilus planipennis]